MIIMLEYEGEDEEAWVRKLNKYAATIHPHRVELVGEPDALPEGVR